MLATTHRKNPPPQSDRDGEPEGPLTSL
ncbi:hypothetical protein SPHINGO361_100060 [Sphingomonas sp. EC-HK361]|nr:hypothetical protein SPHINGO361_100060 [Sphingomonas sp. EC-HK361]